MTLSQRLEYCKVCTKRKTNRDIGLVCSLTDAKPTFENECKEFDSDSKEAEYILQRKLAATGDSTIGNNSDFKKNKEIGLVICCIGVFITLITHVYSDNLGFSLITYGAIIYGGLQYSKGVQQEKIFKVHQEKQKNK